MKKLALISVYNKEGIVDFAKNLTDLNFEIISTGGTYSLLKQNGINVLSIEEFTSFPEILGGRVKTLHPKVFSGILAEKDNTNQLKEIEKLDLRLIDLVVVNLYPFKDTVKKKGVTLEEAIEQIDIGGVSLIRAAAKNFKHVDVLIDQKQYPGYTDIHAKHSGKIPLDYSRSLAHYAFSYVADYDVTISKYFEELNTNNDYYMKLNSVEFPEWLELSSPSHLRYGENPHQDAVLYKEDFDSVFDVFHGKELSYNNILDVDAALNTINEFEDDVPACAIVKHGNPCGVAESDDLLTAFKKAFETDTVSPFGGIIIFNRKLDLKTAMEADKTFSEIILATGFDGDAKEFLMKKKNRRLIKFATHFEKYELRKIAGGVLKQQKNNVLLNLSDLIVVTKMKPIVEQVRDMVFAYKVVKHTKSNAIVFVKDLKTLGIGAGQPSRIDSTKIAINKSREFKHPLFDSVVASDAFFPFADNVEEIAASGAKCIVQPGGSMRDTEVIEAANKYNLIMAFTGFRHFRH